MPNPEKPENTRRRMQSLRDRKRAQGFVNILIWVKKEAVEKVKKYIEKINKKHLTP